MTHVYQTPARRSLLRRVDAGIVGFFNWWLAELAALVPDRFRRVRARHLYDLSGAREDGAAAARRVTRAAVDDEDLPEALAALGRRLARSRGRCVVRLPRSAAFLCSTTLPAAAAETLREVVGYELSRLTPYSTEDALYTVAKVGDLPEVGQIEVRVAAVERALVAPLLQHGDRVRIAVGTADGPDLWLGQKATDAPRVSRLDIALVQIVLLLAVAVLLAPYWRGIEQEAALEADIEAVRGAAERSAELDRAMKDALARREALAQVLYGGAAVVETLEAIATTLPDDTWLTSLEVNLDSATLTGSSGDAAGVLERFGESLLFQNPDFSNAVMHDPETGSQNFTLVMERTAP
jgi:general secretion pathway protein L